MAISPTARSAVEDALARVPGVRGYPLPSDPGFIDLPARKVLVELVLTSGLQGKEPLVYVARRIRYLLGKGDPPTPPTVLRGGGLTDFADRRAVELLEANRHRLPAPNETRMAR